MAVIESFSAALLLLLLSLGCHAQDQPSCTFPAYMQARQHWESHVAMERRMTGQYMDFTQSRMTTREYSAEGDSVTTRDCVQQFTVNKVLVELTVDGVPSYQCMEFVQRSASVAQLKLSQVQPERSEALCDEPSLSLQPWLLVWPFTDNTDEFVPCSLTGGYDMTLFDHQADKAMCDDYYLRARWESDCQGPEGTLIDFRFFDCQGGLSMDTKQALQCLGTWTEGTWEFSVMSNNDELWPKLWLLRHPVIDSQGDEDEVQATLLADLVADTGDAVTQTSRVYTLSMTRKMFESLNEDEAEQCEPDFCEELRGFYCQKTCGTGDALENIPRCQFYQVSRGEWLDISIESTSYVRVANSMLYTDGLLPFQCMQLHAEQWHHGTGRKALVTVFKNGCRPRYNCVELIKRGWNILEYRLGQGTIWPYTAHLVAGHVCGDDNFADDPAPLADRYRNQRKKYLVLKSLRTNRRTPMNCGVTGRYDMQISYKNGQRCSGSLDLCQMNTMRLNVKGCEGIPQRQTFTCIGTMVSEPDTYVMTESDSDPDDVHCWLFQQTEWMGKPTLVVTRPSECHERTMFDVTYKNATNYLAKVEFAAETMDIKNEECTELSSAASAVTTPAAVTTTSTVAIATRVAPISTENATTVAPTTSLQSTEAPTTKQPPFTTKRLTFSEVTMSVYSTSKSRSVGEGAPAKPGSGSGLAIASGLVVVAAAVLSVEDDLYRVL